jgi:7-cyano-7-deazaguanine reductase
MSDQPGNKDILLGRNVPPVTGYAPELLYPIARAAGREKLGMAEPPHGADLWHAYELSWLDRTRKPVVHVGRITVPAGTPNMVESKSLKLYLNSLNNERFDSDEAARQRIIADVGAVTGGRVALDLLAVDDPSLAGTHLDGVCLDDLPAEASGLRDPALDLLSLAECDEMVEEKLYSHLLRSLCPVTGQPDWASVWLHYRGRALDSNALLRYLLAFRNHHEFHEQCVERMFYDISCACEPDFLHIQAFYTRRGGLDINPFRTTEPSAQPLPRLNRQ